MKLKRTIACFTCFIAMFHIEMLMHEWMMLMNEMMMHMLMWCKCFSATITLRCYNVCPLLGSQQSMSKGSVSFAMHRPSSRLDLRAQNPLLPWCILRVPSNHDERVRPARDIFHQPIRIVLLHHNAVRPKECRGYVPMLHAQVFRGSHWADYRGLRGWHRGPIQMG